MEPPILLLVRHALPLRVQGLSHVVQLVNEFVLPSTIDAAVANDLQRVLKAFEMFRPRTMGAMDGAAANGRLDVLQRLHVERDEGCSLAAFIGAASNGHLEVLEWLYYRYPKMRRGMQELTEATRHGHLDIIHFVLRFTPLQQSDREKVLELAAANGHIAVVRVFLRGTIDAHGALVAAAANGHVAVVQLLLDTIPLSVQEALVKAIESGYVEAIELLVKAAGDFDIDTAFRNAAEVISADTMRNVLERCQVDESVLGGVLLVAARTGRSDVVQVLLEKCPPFETTDRNRVWGSSRFTNPIQVAVTTAMINAADANRLGMLRLLVKKSASYAGDMLRHAVENEQWEVQRLLLEMCEEKYMREPRMATVITSMLEQAAADDDVENLQRIFTKCGDVNIGGALRTAVENDSLEIVSLLVKKSESSSIVEALIEAATTGTADMVQALLDHSGHRAIEKALRKTIASGNTEISTMLLARCDPRAHKRIFQDAASSGCAEVLQLLLDEMELVNIHRALTCAAARGHTEAVAKLVELSESSAVACALECAAVEGRVSVVKVLRGYCDSATIRNAVAKAQVVGYDDVVQLLGSKNARLE